MTPTKISNVIPMVALSLAFLSLFGAEYSSWVRYSAVLIAAITILGWLLSESAWIGIVIKNRFFPTKLTKDQKNRLDIFLDQIENFMSYSCTYSPFYVWHSCSNSHIKLLRMDYPHHNAIFSWLNDLKLNVELKDINQIKFMESLSRAISESSKLAEKAEHQIQELFGNESIDSSEKKQIKKQWDTAKTHFNRWLADYSLLCKEVNKKNSSNCFDYYRTLEMIE
jgi:hypothetical protein